MSTENRNDKTKNRTKRDGDKEILIKCEIHGYDFKNNAETCIQCSKNKHFYDYSTIGGIKEAYNKDTKGGNS